MAWKMDKLGISSEDMKTENEISSHYGTKWKMKGDKNGKTPPQPERKAADAPKREVAEASKVEKVRYDKFQLEAMKKDDIIDIAKGMSIDDTMTKNQMIDAIVKASNK